MEGKSLTVSFAEPKQTLQEQQATPAKSKACYVGGLPPGVTDEKIKEIFTKYGEVRLTHLDLHFPNLSGENVIEKGHGDHQ